MVGANGTESATGSLLSTAAGRELLGRLADRDVGPDRALALSESLRADYPAELIAAALTQQALRNAARAKFSRAGQMLFTRDGLEQASSELTAAHAAGRFAGPLLVADLCCGIGGNLVALAAASATAAGPAPPPAPAPAPVPAAAPAAPSMNADSSRPDTPASVRDHGRHVVGVDADLTASSSPGTMPPSARQGQARRFVCADVTALPLGGIDAVFIDPAAGTASAGWQPGNTCRRWNGACGWPTPFPGLASRPRPALRRELVPPGWETEFVAVGRDLKEALLWSPALAAGGGGGGRRCCRAAIRSPPRDPAPQRQPARLAEPGAYLLDPSPAVTRAGWSPTSPG